MDTSTKQRICFFLGALSEGGGERVVSILSKYIANQDSKVEIVLFRNKPIFYEISSKVKIRIVEEETESKSFLKNLLWVRSYFKKNADIIISFLAPFNMIALVADMGVKTPLIVADRNDPRHVPSNSVVRKIRDYLYRFADGLVFQTEYNKSYFSKMVQSKSLVIQNPIDLGENAGLALRTEKKKRIVSVGRLMPQKNQEMLIRAFGEIKDKYPEHTLTIYGEGPQRDSLEKIIQENGLTDRVFLPGAVTNIPEHIADAELFVLSSNYEGMPNALIEAMCLGLPCISTEVSGAAELIQHGISGKIVPVGHVRILSQEIDYLLSDDKARMDYAQNAVKLNSILNVKTISQKWIELIRSKGVI